MNTPTLNELKSWFAKNENEIYSDFFTFLKFPSISTDPNYIPDIHKTAQWLKGKMESFGLEAELWQGDGHPVVFGKSSRGGAKAPTLLLYGHYDVQPVDPLDLWKSPPFAPEMRGKEIYARGAVDDKGQAFYMLQAVRAFLEMTKDAPLNLKIFIEGEEECGSKGTYSVLRKHKADLKADHLLVVDMGMIARDEPAVTLGTRGLVTMQVDCIAAKTDLHSGAHGGMVLNPNRALAVMLSKLWDESGKVAVPGFYDRVHALSAQEKREFHMPFDVAEYEKVFGIKALAPEPGFSPAESNLLRPTIEINGMSGGYTGHGFKTVIPAKATAKISSRLVPDQDPLEIGNAIAAFLRKNCPEGLDLKIDIHPGAKAFRGSPRSRISQVAAQAYQELFNKTCAFSLSGGSIPIVPDLAAVSGAEATMVGVGLEDDDIHAPNEHFGWDRFQQGFLSLGRMLALLSAG